MKRSLYIVWYLMILLLVIHSNKSSYAGNGIEVKNFDEFRHWLTQENDSIYVINFWATWCAPCVKEIPAFEELNSKYKDQKVKVLLVSLDFPAQVESRVVPFIDRMNMKSQVLLLNDPDANRWIPLVDESWSGAIPATLIYTKGHRKFYEKEFTYPQLEAVIKPLIN